MRHETLVGVLLIANMLMATRLTLTKSLSRSPRSIKRTSRSIFYPKHSNKSLPCPLWSSSFSICIDSLHKSTSPSFTSSRRFSSSSSSSMATSALNDVVEANPLLDQFVFPPFDAVEPKHVRP
ncbi:oligopeptidase A-like, partial [Trifolium medium]|nr:oligopeptidase A-like [Trifolium medium]